MSPLKKLLIINIYLSNVFSKIDLSLDGEIESIMQNNYATQAEDKIKELLKQNRVEDERYGGSKIGIHKTNFQIKDYIPMIWKANYKAFIFIIPKTNKYQAKNPAILGAGQAKPWHKKFNADSKSVKYKNWGVDIAKCINIYYKVCDEGEYFLVDGVTIKNRLKYNDEYVPSFLSIGKNGYGDYIIMSIGKDGFIKNWKKPDLKENEWHEVDYWKSL